MAVSKTKRPKYKLTKFSKFVLTCGVLLVVVAGIVLLFQKQIKHFYDDTVYPREYVAYVEQYAKEYELDENFVYAVIKAESGFNPEAISNVGAKGLMQVTEETFDWISEGLGYTQYEHDDLYNPKLGIEYGCYLLGYLQGRFSNYEVMLSGYHAGMTITATWLEDQTYSDDGVTLKEVPYKDTAHYIDKVMDYYQAYQSIYG